MRKIVMAFGVLLCVFAVTGCCSIPSQEKSGQAQKISSPKEIVFIHGMFVTPKCWDEWQRYFSQQGYQVSAPAWPMHESRVEGAQLGSLTLEQVLDSYRKILIPKKDHPPILIGHSMGGLIAQILLNEGLASAAIAIDSAPPKGVLALSPSFIVSNWGAISPFADLAEPIRLNQGEFSYAFMNMQSVTLQESAYRDFYVPESRRVGKAPTTDVALIDPKKKRGPLLIIAGGSDHIIPAKLNYKNFELYKDSENETEFKMFPGRDHWTIAAPGWQDVAAFASEWIKSGH